MSQNEPKALSGPKAAAEARRKMMLEGKLLRIIPAIALPQVLTMLVDSLYNITDTYFVSQLGDAAMAAVSVNDTLMNIIRAFAMIFGMGASSYVSRLLGAGKDEEASRASSTTAVSAFVCVTLVAIGCLTFLPSLVDLLGATPTGKPFTMDYAKWTLIFCPVTALDVCLSQSLRAEGSTRYSMIGTCSGCLVNVVLDPIFITTLGMGVGGAAIATGISKVISAFVLMLPFLRHKSLLTISPKLFTPKLSLYGEIFRMGLPVGLRSFVMNIAAIIINRIAAGYGDVALAAIGIGNKSMRLVGSAVMGFGQGYQPIAGFCYGAKRYGRVRQAYLTTSAIGLSLAAVLGILLAIFARQMVGIFTSTADTAALGVVLIVSQSVVLPFHVMTMLSSGLFQAMGKPLNSAFLGFSRQVFALIPAVLILNWLFGVNGLVVSQAVADLISFAICAVIVLPWLGRLKKMQAEEDGKGEEERRANEALALESELFDEAGCE